MMLALTIYVIYKSRTRWGTHWQKYGPTYLMCISTVLVMADPIRHLLNDYDLWPGVLSNGWGSNEYRDGCDSETAHCLSTVGILFTIIATYVGFFLLAVATLWNANICDKLKDIRAEWRRLRGTDQEEAAAPAPTNYESLAESEPANAV